MQLLMCRPDYYGIEYEINPWMNINHKADFNKAIHQWETLYKTILQCGANVELIPPVTGWPDMTFTANAGLYYQDKIILSHFKYAERQGEEPYFLDWFIKAGFNVLNQPTPHTENLYFEGAGDALLAGNILFAGYGFRTVREFYEQATYLDHDNIVYCELANPYFYHLDTCFCPLDDKLAIWCPSAFTPDSQQRMSEHIELLPVSEAEAKRFACNAVVINEHIIVPAQCPELSSMLDSRGFTVHACDMDEYLKAGGACKCLTLRLD